MIKYLEWFKRDGERALMGLVFTDVPAKVVLKKYESLVPIENIPVNEKQDIWNYAKELFPGRAKDELIRAAKIIYTIGTLS